VSDISDEIKAAWLEVRAALDPVVLTGPNGKTAQVIPTSFLQSKILSEASYDSKLPAVVELLREDYKALAIKDRSTVQIYGLSLTVTVIGDDPLDPIIALTLTQFS
jgi:hypothetical protein